MSNLNYTILETQINEAIEKLKNLTMLISIEVEKENEIEILEDYLDEINQIILGH